MLDHFYCSYVRSLWVNFKNQMFEIVIKITHTIDFALTDDRIIPNIALFFIQINMSFEQKPLSYDMSALAPCVSAHALDLHYNKHYKSYLTNLNNLDVSNFGSDLPSIIKNSFKDPSVQFVNSNIKVFNNAAQAWNHEFYWDSMVPNGGGEIDACSELGALIKTSGFNDFSDFVAKFKEISMAQFGSGWSWLVYNNECKKIEIISTSNAYTPLTSCNLTPLLTIDVWEHAYYVNFENRRVDYLGTFFEKLVNWKFAQDNLTKSLVK